MDGLGWDGVFVEHLIEFDSVVDVADKDDDLIELEQIDEVHQFGDLVALFKANIVLAETVKSQLALLLNENLGGVAHEFAAS